MRIFEILDADERITEMPNAVVMTAFENSIEYKGVSFAYDNEKNDKTYVLDHIDLVIPKGKKVAIVGPSGAGKTTLADLLPRFYDPTGGEISIDGTPIKTMNINSLRRNIGVVSQNCILFNDTIANNITFGLKDVPLERIREAARIKTYPLNVYARRHALPTPMTS